MPPTEDRIVHQLAEAHAVETSLAQTLASHVALTPGSEMRDALERHLAVTRVHGERIVERLGELGHGQRRLRRAQAALGQMLAATRVPLTVLRGTGMEERLLRTARGEVASQALALATYDALEAVAVAAGDQRTADLAREHRAAGEGCLAELRTIVAQLARDVHAADMDATATAGAAPADGRRVDDVQAAARAAADEVRANTQRTRAPRRSS